MAKTHPSNRLREIRISKGVTQVQLAALTPVSIATLWMLEHDKGNVSRRKKIKIAAALGLEVGQVFPEEAGDD